MGHIYKIENLINGKVYIGQTTWLKKRLNAHKNLLKKGEHPNTYLQRSWDKYGEDCFIIEVLEECDVDMLNAREKYWISFYDCYSNRDNGYNQTTGGDGTRGLIVSKETKCKMSTNHWDCSGENNPMYGKDVKDYMTQKQIEQWKEKISIANKGKNNAFYGKVHTEETKQLLSEKAKLRYATGNVKRSQRVYTDEDKERMKLAMIGRFVGKDNPNSKSVICLNNLMVFDTIKEASAWAGITFAGIVEVCRKRKRSAGEIDGSRLAWMYYEEFIECKEDLDIANLIAIANTKRATPNTRKVRCVQDGLDFDSISIAGQYYDIDSSSIAKNCKQKVKHCNSKKFNKKVCFEYI